MNKKKKIKYINISERKVLLRLFDVLSVLVGIYFIANVLDVSYITFDNEMTPKWVLTFLVYFLLFGHIFEMYNLKVSSSRFLAFQSTLITTFTSIMFYMFTPRLTPSLPNDRIEVLYLFLAVLIPTTFWRFVYSTYIFSPRLLKNILIIGNAKHVQNILTIIEKKNFQNNIICYIADAHIPSKASYKYIPIQEANLLEIVQNTTIDEIVLSENSIDLSKNPEISKQIIYLFEQGINIKSIENLYEEITLSIAQENLNKDFYKHISFSKNHENTFYLLFVRVFDIFIGLLGLLSLLFFIPFVFVGNLIANRGPLFYKQVRVGRNGAHFNIYKFRSMIVNAEQEGKAVWASKNDTRITLFGKFLRKTRIDEIPQFLNILVGEMSLIGPRPERPEFVTNLQKELPFYAIRHVISPGLTGWAQVMFPYANTIREQGIKLRYDLYYIKSRGLFLDFKILIKTIATVLRFRGQ